MSVSARPVRAGRIAPPPCPCSYMDAKGEVGRRLASQSVRARTRFFGGTGFDLALESGHATIARMMLAPCSASSMLSAALRPGNRPGLRALTTPARGTDWQLCDGGRSDEDNNDVDDQRRSGVWWAHHLSAARYSSGSHNGIRSAHSADASRARLECTLHDITARYSGPLAMPRSQDHAPPGGSVHQWHDRALV